MWFCLIQVAIVMPMKEDDRRQTKPIALPLVHACAPVPLPMLIHLVHVQSDWLHTTLVCVIIFLAACYNLNYRSLAKEGPLWIVCHAPSFACRGLKLIQVKERPPSASIANRDLSSMW